MATRRSLFGFVVGLLGFEDGGVSYRSFNQIHFGIDVLVGERVWDKNSRRTFETGQTKK